MIDKMTFDHVRARFTNWPAVQSTSLTVGGVVLFLVLPFLFSETLASQIIAFAIFASGFHFLVGYGGQISFGHAAFFGTGAYFPILLMKHFQVGFVVAIAVSLFIVLVLSIIIGYLSIRRRGIYFAMITLAFGQMIFAIFSQYRDITGGLSGIFLPDSPDIAIGGLALFEGFGLYYVLSFWLLAVVLAIHRLLQTPFGKTLVAVRENEERAAALGYNTNNILLLAFTISGFISGLGGIAYLLVFQFVTPNILFWETSGDVVIYTIIGGVGGLLGPLFGATIGIWIQDSLSDLSQSWPVLYGAIIMAIVIFAPRGITGLYEDISEYIRDRYM